MCHLRGKVLKVLLEESWHLAIRYAQILQPQNFGLGNEWQQTWTQSVRPYITKERPTGFDSPRKVWKTANRIQTGFSSCADLLSKLGKILGLKYNCGKTNQIISHLSQERECCTFQGDAMKFFVLSTDATELTKHLDINI